MSTNIGSERAAKAWKTIHKSGRMMHVEIGVRMKNRTVGKLRIGPNHVGWIPPGQEEPIERTWEEFGSWMKGGR
jgi:hypothetical protein